MYAFVVILKVITYPFYLAGLAIVRAFQWATRPKGAGP